MQAAGSTRDRDVVAEARRLIEAAAAEQIGLWAIGGAAIHLLAGNALHRGLTRELKDIDLVARAHQRERAAGLLAREGYQPDEEFNALQGSRRLLFWDPEHRRQLDVFVERFAMCHEVPLDGRLHEGRPTLHPAELLLTKLQIVKLNEKDRVDAYAILLHHEVDEHDEQAVNVARVAELCGRDWGLWRTTQLTLDRLEAGLADSPLSAVEQAVIAERVQRIRDAIDRAPKALGWKVRARVGDRVRWYEDPDEVADGGF